MLKKLKAFWHRLTGHKTPAQPTGSQPSVRYGDKVGNVTISTPAQLIKHTAFKPGESYRLGEMIVTVHATKESMLKAIAKVEARRLAKEHRLRERAIDIMMMSPEQLMQFKVHEWLEARKRPQAWYKKLFNLNARYTAPIEPQISGNKQERFAKALEPAQELQRDELLATVNDKDTVN